MKITLSSPSALEGVMARPTAPLGKALVSVKPGEELAVVTPIRFSRAQKTIFVVPFECESERGAILDKGYIAVNTKTGKLSIEHCAEPIPLDVDVPDTVDKKE